MAVVLLYHRVTVTASDPWGLNVSPGNFGRHVEIIASAFEPITLMELVGRMGERSLRGREVVVTFDDGYLDNLQQALPVLERWGVPATFFVPSGQLGATTEFWWDELDRVLLQPGILPRHFTLRLADAKVDCDLGDADRYGPERAEQYRTWLAWEPPPTARHALYASLWQRCHGLDPQARSDVLRQLRECAGLEPAARPTHRLLDEAQLVTLGASSCAEIGGHTVSHPSLAVLTADEQYEEVAGGKRHLEAALQRPVTSFAYPFGKRSDYDDRSRGVLRAAGFTCACTNEPDRVTNATPVLDLPRLFVRDLDAGAFSRWLAECSK